MIVSPSRATTVAVTVGTSSGFSSREHMPIWAAPVCAAFTPAVEPPP